MAERTNQLEVACRKCDRRSVLVREHGASFPMAELRQVLAGSCERLKAGKLHDPCGCHFPELPALFGVGTE